jgi:Mg/Co/Ni transporter MgtE
MSPRAAWRLEHLGCDQSFDYVGGKLDWLSFDLPWHGAARLVGRELDRAVPTCHLGEKLGELRARSPAPLPVVVVLDDNVVAGTLEKRAFDAGDDELVDHVMRPDPPTVRPSEEVDELRGRMHERSVNEIVVTRSDGRLVGVYRAG